MTKEINLKILLKVLKSAWWKILIFTVAVAIAVGVVTHFVVPKKYTSSVEFYVLNTSTTSEYTTTALLSAAEYLSNDYIKIINGDRMMNTIKEYIKDPNRDTTGAYANMSVSALRSMISSDTSTESSTFTITVTATEDRNLAFYITECITLNAPNIIKEITRPSYNSNLYKKVTEKDSSGKVVSEDYLLVTEEDLECVKVLRSPEVAASHSSPSIPTYVMISALLAIVASYLFFLILTLSDTTIRSEENAKELVDQTVIGGIPNWSVNSSAEKETKEDKQK